MSNWISVKDKLPEVNELVLCHIHYGCGSTDVATGSIWEEGGKFFLTFDQDGYGDIVTHWMPLPNIPDLSDDD